MGDSLILRIASSGVGVRLKRLARFFVRAGLLLAQYTCHRDSQKRCASWSLFRGHPRNFRLSVGAFTAETANSTPRRLPTNISYPLDCYQKAVIGPCQLLVASTAMILPRNLRICA